MNTISDAVKLVAALVTGHWNQEVDFVTVLCALMVCAIGVSAMRVVVANVEVTTDVDTNALLDIGAEEEIQLETPVEAGVAGQEWLVSLDQSFMK